MFLEISRIHRRLISELLGKPLVGNALRGTLVEAIVAEALAPKWRWCADGWGSFDFEGPNGVGLEVKQSAARQNWHGPETKPCPARFDIAERTGFWNRDGKWISTPGRAARIYIFAHHAIADIATADHRITEQWDFYVVPARSLPKQKSIGLNGVQSLAPSVRYEDLLSTVEAVRSKLAQWPKEKAVTE